MLLVCRIRGGGPFAGPLLTMFYCTVESCRRLNLCLAFVGVHTDGHSFLFYFQVVA